MIGLIANLARFLHRWGGPIHLFFQIHRNS
jgi:hypothetical protein